MSQPLRTLVMALLLGSVALPQAQAAKPTREELGMFDPRDTLGTAVATLYFSIQV